MKCILIAVLFNLLFAELKSKLYIHHSFVCMVSLIVFSKMEMFIPFRNGSPLVPLNGDLSKLFTPCFTATFSKYVSATPKDYILST